MWLATAQEPDLPFLIGERFLALLNAEKYIFSV
jgi:hypothetical protein